MLFLGILGWPGAAALGQYFSNPSFEGVPGISVSPPSWEPFDPYSTPDTEPVGCDRFQAAEGDTYMTLITRGAGQPIPNSVENAMTQLVKSLESGSYYRLTVELASRQDLGHFSWVEGFIAYNAPVKLLIYGSESASGRGDLLSESAAITNAVWESYSFILAPQSVITHLLVEASMAGAPEGMGNLLLDHIQIEELDEPPLDYGELSIPNVFTPNGDGINDELVIRGLPGASYLAIYDRVGTEVFRSYNYEQNWKGTSPEGSDLPAGTYWYILLPSNSKETFKGFIYLKRE